ncbi:MAG: hypothetical protein ABEJ75_04225 [Candidatus Nanohaloarchaea archaeon]
MLEEKGAIGVGTILALTLGLLVASVTLSAITTGAIGDLMDMGFGRIQNNTDFTIDIEGGEKGAKTLSAAAKYVYQRASNDGCGKNGLVAQENNEDGYPALSGTYLGRYPECVGASSTVIRGKGKGAVQELGKDMEGIYSRVKFEVTGNKPVVINTAGDLWLENHLRGAAKGSFYDRTLESCGQSAIKAGITAGTTVGTTAGIACASVGGVVIPGIGVIGGGACGAAAGTLAFVSALAGDAIAGARFVGSGKNYNVFFEGGDVDDRALWFYEDANRDFSESLYCYAATEAIMNADPTKLQFTTSPIDAAYQNQGSRQQIVLCPGDEGYIQVNKGEPHNSGEAGEKFRGFAYKYPFIQITELGKSCGDKVDMSQPNQPEWPTVLGTVTTDITKVATGGNNDVVQVTGSEFTFLPENSPAFSDYLVWQRLPPGDKKIRIVLEFQKKGHLQIDAQAHARDGRSETVTYINTDAYGRDKIWIMKPGGTYEETGINYETGKEYTIILTKTAGANQADPTISWKIKEEGTQIYSYTTASTRDFRRLVFESWQTKTKPRLKVKEVTILDQ